MWPKWLQAVGNGVSLLPWRKITGVRSTSPAAPNPSTGVPRDASEIVGNPAGNDVPTVPEAFAPATTVSAMTSDATTTRIFRTVTSETER